MVDDEETISWNITWITTIKFVIPFNQMFRISDNAFHDWKSVWDTNIAVRMGLKEEE